MATSWSLPCWPACGTGVAGTEPGDPAASDSRPPSETDADSPTTSTVPSGYTTLVDNTGQLTVAVPGHGTTSTSTPTTSDGFEVPRIKRCDGLDRCGASRSSTRRCSTPHIRYDCRRRCRVRASSTAAGARRSRRSWTTTTGRSSAMAAAHGLRVRRRGAVARHRRQPGERRRHGGGDRPARRAAGPRCPRGHPAVVQLHADGDLARRRSTTDDHDIDDDDLDIDDVDDDVHRRGDDIDEHRDVESGQRGTRRSSTTATCSRRHRASRVDRRQHGLGVNDDGSYRPTIAAAPDIAEFVGGFDIPGTRLFALPPDVDPATVLANVA